MSVSRLMDQAEWKIVGAGERLCRASLGREGGRVPHLGVVLAAWDPAAAAESVELVLERLRGLTGVKCSMVVVANHKTVTSALPRANGEYTMVAGSNREAEFSAYEEGRQSLVAETGASPDVWVIVNDRLPFYKADCLWGVTPALVQFASSVPIAAGTIDFLSRYFNLWGQKFRCYIRSNYIMVSANAIDRAGSLCAVSAENYASEVPTAFPEDWPISAWIGPELGESLRIFLTVPGGVRWTRAEPLSPASWPRLRMKVLSIINEWLLSLRLIDAQVPIVPWRLARAMSCLSPGDPFLYRLLEQYRADPGFGGGLEASAYGRLQLATAVLAGRAGATKIAETFLSSAAKSSSAATAIRPEQQSQKTSWTLSP
jgi:hypothetical protein